MKPEPVKRGRGRPRGCRPTVIVNMRIAPEVADELAGTCERLGMTREEFIVKACEMMRRWETAIRRKSDEVWTAAGENFRNTPEVDINDL